jgi:hypothetical protein
VERQPQEKPAVRNETIRKAPAGPQHARRHPEDVPAGAVQLADASEARCEGDLQNGEVGVVEQAAGEVSPRRPCQAVRRHPDVGPEEPAQVAGGHTQAHAELRLRSPVERAVEDEPHRPADELRTVPRQGLRRPVRPAAEARPIAGGLGGGGERELRHVLGPRAGRASRPAVDTGRDDRREGFHAARYTGWTGFATGRIRTRTGFRPDPSGSSPASGSSAR